MKRRQKKTRGISPIITTVLLIGLVVVILGIVFLWFKGIVEEGVTKFGKNIKLVCDDVEFQAEYTSQSSTSGTLNIVNNGNIPLFKISLKISSGGNYKTEDLETLSNKWPANGLNTGGTFSDTIEIGAADKITVLPILIGNSEKGKKTFMCGGQYSEEIEI